jgi:glycosyltransferase involved in cell wall biosynthesis
MLPAPPESSPYFSLLVANYNNSRYLSTCIESVYDQTVTDWEILIVDDGSTDEFEQVIERYKNDSRIKIFRNGSNMGCSYTKNRLAAIAQGVVLAYLDPDDTLHKEALEVMEKAHRNHPACSLIHSTHFICDENLIPVRVADYPKPLPPGTPYLLLSDGSVHAFASFKKACYDDTDFLSKDRRYDKAIDQELYYLLEETGDLFYIDQPLYYYRIHAGSISNMGNEYEATNQHYEIIMNRCRKRIKVWSGIKTQEAAQWVRRYNTRFHRIRIVYSLRQKKWISLLSSALQYPFIGGGRHLWSYLAKLPREGTSLIRKTLGNYRIYVKAEQEGS